MACAKSCLAHASCREGAAELYYNSLARLELALDVRLSEDGVRRSGNCLFVLREVTATVERHLAGSIPIQPRGLDQVQMGPRWRDLRQFQSCRAQ